MLQTVKRCPICLKINQKKNTVTTKHNVLCPVFVFIVSLPKFLLICSSFHEGTSYLYTKYYYATCVNPFHSGYQPIGTLANSKEPDEMPHKAAFHQGLHCLLKHNFIKHLTGNPLKYKTDNSILIESIYM